MRIIAGIHRGRILKPPTDQSIRPTSDKVRGAIFNILMHASFMQNRALAEMHVADIFCGTGAFGLEALSRGALGATFIDQSSGALHLTKANAGTLKMIDQCRFLKASAPDLPKPSNLFDLVFLDPPYRKNMLEVTLSALIDKAYINHDSIIVAEAAADETLSIPEQFIPQDVRIYGETKIFFLSLA
jgi:16S rRNA (guanine966-N2)-methyltransferase